MDRAGQFGAAFTAQSRRFNQDRARHRQDRKSGAVVEKCEIGLDGIGIVAVRGLLAISSNPASTPVARRNKPANISFLLAGEVEFMTLYRETLPMLTSSIRNAPGPEFSSL